MPRERARVIAPSIDPLSAKNRTLEDGEISAVLTRAGLLGGDVEAARAVSFATRDGTVRQVRRHTGLLPGPPPPASARLVVQVSRWDRLKDMAGVLRAFADHVVPFTSDVHLVLAGPDVSGVRDDPEGAQVLAECRAAWALLPTAARDRCHLACVPMDDVDENAVIVNALQRRATVVVQKSLREGFGLTVAEAMWKSRPVVASAVGGIQDQVSDGDEGLLLTDPRDLPGFAALVLTVLDELVGPGEVVGGGDAPGHLGR